MFNEFVNKKDSMVDKDNIDYVREYFFISEC